MTKQGKTGQNKAKQGKKGQDKVCDKGMKDSNFSQPKVRVHAGRVKA